MPSSLPISPQPPTAAVILVGNELLSGKTRDENGYFLARMLRRRGIRLLEICTVGDDIHGIGQTLLRVLPQVDLVFTSGGLGSTHDDVTLPAIAEATKRPLQRSSEMEQILHSYFREQITQEALRMADLPEGTQLCASPGWPVLRMDVASNEHQTRIYILPGIPELCRAKIEALEQISGELPQTKGWSLKVLLTKLEESRLALPLQQIAQKYPQVEIGSYPSWRSDAQGKLWGIVQVTIEAPVVYSQDVELAHQELATILAHHVLGEEENHKEA